MKECLLCDIIYCKPEEILKTVYQGGLEFYICENINLKNSEFIFPKEHVKNLYNNKNLLYNLYCATNKYIRGKDVRLLQNFNNLCSERNHVHWHILYDSYELYDLINGDDE